MIQNAIIVILCLSLTVSDAQLMYTFLYPDDLVRHASSIDCVILTRVLEAAGSSTGMCVIGNLLRDEYFKMEDKSPDMSDSKLLVVTNHPLVECQEQC